MINKLEYDHLSRRQKRLFPYSALTDFTQIAQNSSKVLDIGADISTFLLLKYLKGVTVSCVYQNNKTAKILNQFIGRLGKYPEPHIEAEELCNALHELDGNFDLVRVMHTDLTQAETEAILLLMGNEAQVWLYNSRDAEKFVAAYDVDVQHDDLVTVVRLQKTEHSPYANLPQPQDTRTLADCGDPTSRSTSIDSNSTETEAVDLQDDLWGNKAV